MKVPVPMTVESGRSRRIQAMKYDYNNPVDQKALATLLKKETEEELAMFMLKRLNPNFELSTTIHYAVMKYSHGIATTAFNRLSMVCNIKVRKDTYTRVYAEARHASIRNQALNCVKELQNVIPFNG